jgi:ketosteroid isomerase-like protein
MSNIRNSMIKRIAMFVLLFSTTCFAQASTVEPAARKGIDAGNQAWIDGMKSGDAASIVATYTDNALDCSPTGECASGRTAIAQNIQKLFAKSGRAQRAQVDSMGSVQEGDFVYEWGRAEASFAKGNHLVDRYLTVWHREADGSWKIFRNMVIPGDKRE